MKHGASQMSAYSGSIRALYDLAFGYVDGDASRPDMAAGIALRSALRIGLGYKGSIFYKMQSGMGDIVMTPLYEILKKRGVNFKFFHAVKNLGLNDDKTQIDTVEIGVQAHVKSGEYNPLYDVKGLACWPSLPFYDQLVEGEELQASDINLESFWSPWKDPETLNLKRGVDFDEVVLGIPVAAHPYICPELISASEKWADMTSKVQTCRTLAMQLWNSKSLQDLGWDMDSPVMDGYAQKFNTWADMSQVIPSENFPDEMVKNIAYYCGPMPGGIPPRTETDFPARALRQVQQQGISWLGANSGYLWPKVAPLASAEGFDYSVLVDPSGATGEDRIYSQYHRANIDPSERYVLSLTDTTKYRLKPGESGFSNLKLAGDWTDNEFNVGCVEATVMSGLLASNALCGYPKREDIAGINHA